MHLEKVGSMGGPKYTERIKEKEKSMEKEFSQQVKNIKLLRLEDLQTSGFKPVDNTVIFDDDVNGFDKMVLFRLEILCSINPNQNHQNLLKWYTNSPIKTRQCYWFCR